MATSFAGNDESAGVAPVSGFVMPGIELCVGVQQIKTPSSFIQLVLNAVETGHNTSEKRQQKHIVYNNCEGRLILLSSISISFIFHTFNKIDDCSISHQRVNKIEYQAINIKL